MAEKTKNLPAKKAYDPKAEGDIFQRVLGTDLIERAARGDVSTVPDLRELLKLPEANEFIDSLGGNLAKETERNLIKNAAGENLSFKLSLSRKLQLMRNDLAGPNPTPLEKLLAERIALCWLALHLAELRYSQTKQPTFKQDECWQRCIDHAHRRYLTAIKTLATVRKLTVPVVQVNIAKRQTNIACAAAVLPAEKETS